MSLGSRAWLSSALALGLVAAAPEAAADSSPDPLDGVSVGLPPLDEAPEPPELDALSVGTPYDVAQYPPPPGTRPPGTLPPPGTRPAPGYPPPGYQPGPGFGVQRRRPVSSGLEIGFLYTTAAVYGIGTGIWINEEAKVREPGVYVIAPAAFGAAMPLAVFLVDRFAYTKGMPEGLPSAIASGAIIGAAGGVGIAAYQWASVSTGKEWGWIGVARAEFVGATVGAGAGVGLYYLIKPRPEHNVLLMSSVVWGAGIGAAFGGGASKSFGNWSETNDAVSLGSNIGMGVALAGAVTASVFWTPSWEGIGWMYAGFGLGTVASLPIYFAYIGSDRDPRRGLIAQGIGAIAGVGLAAALAPRYRYPGYAANDTDDPDWIKVRGVGLMPVEQGLGAQMTGELW